MYTLLHLKFVNKKAVCSAYKQVIMERKSVKISVTQQNIANTVERLENCLQENEQTVLDHAMKKINQQRLKYNITLCNLVRNGK